MKVNLVWSKYKTEVKINLVWSKDKTEVKVNPVRITDYFLVVGVTVRLFWLS